MPTAIWNSYSKSDTARRPRIITEASTSTAKYIRKLSNGRTTVTFGRGGIEMLPVQVAHDL